MTETFMRRRLVQSGEDIVRRALEELILERGASAVRALRKNIFASDMWERCVPEAKDRWAIHRLLLNVQRRMQVPEADAIALLERETAFGESVIWLTPRGERLIYDVRFRILYGRAQRDRSNRRLIRQTWRPVFLAIGESILIANRRGYTSLDGLRAFCRDEDVERGFRTLLTLLPTDDAGAILREHDATLRRMMAGRQPSFCLLDERGGLTVTATLLLQEVRYEIVRHASAEVRAILSVNAPSLPAASRSKSSDQKVA